MQAFLLCGKAFLLRDTIKGTHCIHEDFRETYCTRLHRHQLGPVKSQKSPSPCSRTCNLNSNVSFFKQRFRFTVGIGTPSRAGVAQSVQRLGYELDGPGFESRLGKDVFSSLKGPHWLLGSPSLLLNGYLGTFRRVRRPGLEVNLSAPRSAKVKNEWSYTSFPPLCLLSMQGQCYYTRGAQNSGARSSGRPYPVRWRLMSLAYLHVLYLQCLTH